MVEEGVFCDKYMLGKTHDVKGLFICLWCFFLLTPVTLRGQDKLKSVASNPLELEAADPEIRQLLDETRSTCDQLSTNDRIERVQKGRVAALSPRSWIRSCSGCPMFVPHGRTWGSSVLFLVFNGFSISSSAFDLQFFTRRCPSQLAVSLSLNKSSSCSTPNPSDRSPAGA
jgi:hypothetical protein